MSDLYREAAALLLKLEKRQGGLKSLAYGEDIQHKRSSFALVCETLRYKPLLQEMLQAVPAFKLGQVNSSKNKKKHESNQQQRALVLLCLYDLLFGKHKKIQGGGALKKKVMQFANAFREALVRKKIKARVKDAEELLPVENRKQQLALPRFVRINTLKTSVDEMKDFMAQYQAQLDQDVANLLILPSGTELHEHEFVKDGKIVLQDKASCFPAFILHGEHGDNDDGDVIDACAAPGNKTSHAAMLIASKRQNQKTTRARKVFAFDRSVRRLETLKNRMKQVGADEIVVPCLKDFLEVDVNEPTFANVTSILLDPSCSGSGMINRLDHLLDIASSQDTVHKDQQTQQQPPKRHQKPEENENEYDQPSPDQENDSQVAARLDSLADFQLKALLKAFSFPQVQRITYSTCSVFEKENEEVVSKALNSSQNQTSKRPFQLKKCLASWKRRGVPAEGLSAAESECLVRANGLEDHTNGFFVSYFERGDRSCGQILAGTSEKKNKETGEVGEASAQSEEEEDDEEVEQVQLPVDAATNDVSLSLSLSGQSKKRKRNKKKKTKRNKKPNTSSEL